MSLSIKSAISALAAVAALMVASAVQAVPIITNLEDATNGGGFFAKVTFEDFAVDTVKVTADISAPVNTGLTKGDILGLWLDIADENLLLGLVFGNESPTGIITGMAMSADSVGGVGSANNNLNGTHETGFDIGVALGAHGAGAGFNQTVSFTMASSGLTASEFDGQRLGMRVQSIEGGSFGQGSSKLIGSGGGTICDPQTDPVCGDDATTIPSPGTLLMLILGLAGLGLTRRKRSTHN